MMKETIICVLFSVAIALFTVMCDAHSMFVVSGPGLHMPSPVSRSQNENGLVHEDLVAVVSRQLGVETSLGLSTKELPTSDVFSRPSAVALFVINEISASSVTPATTPYLHSLLSNTGNYVNTLHTRPGALLPVSFADSLAASFPTASVQQYSVDAVRRGCGKGSNSVSLEFEHLIEQFMEMQDRNRAKIGPDAFVFKFNTFAGRDNNENEVDAKVSDLVKKLNEMYGEKLALNVVFGDGEHDHLPQKKGRNLTEKNIKVSSFLFAEDNVTGVTDSVTDQEKIEFTLVVWTNIFLAFLLFFVFCCVDWQAEMDPILYSTFKEDTKQATNS